MCTRPFFAFAACLLAPVLALTLTFAPRSAAAAGADTLPVDVSPAARAEAHAHYKRGVKLFHDNDFAAALAAFEQAAAIAPHWKTTQNIAICELRLGRPLNALRHLKYAMRDPKANRSDLEPSLHEAYAATGHVAITTTDGASIALDGQAPVGMAPLEGLIDVTAGRHELIARIANRTQSVTVNVAAGVLTPVEIRLPPQDTAPPVAATPVPSSPIPATTATATPANIATTSAPPPLEREPAPFWTLPRSLGVGVAAAGAGALVGAGVLLGQSQSAKNRAGSLRNEVGPTGCAGAMPLSACGALEDAYSEQSHDLTLSNIFFGAGLAGVVAGGALFLWPTLRGSGAVLVPLASHGTAGLELRGAFE